MQRVMQVPSALISALNGLIVLLVVGSEFFRRRQMRRADKRSSQQEGTVDAKEDS